MRTFLSPVVNPVVSRVVRSAAWIHRRTAGPDPVCSLVSCLGTRPLWQRLIGRRFGIVFHGSFYCGPKCLQTALVGQISRLRSLARPAPTASRMPLGLLMVARGKLTPVEVQAALEAQRRARYGTIGDWIEKLGFASEQDVTAALALQWGCPVASSFDRSGFDHTSFDHTGFGHGGFDQAHAFASPDFPCDIPLRILEAFQMVPFSYAASTNTLNLACGIRVDHAALYAMERLLECRLQPCVAAAKSVRRRLEQMRQLARSSDSDVEFVTSDLGEMGRISSSYIARLSPEDVRLSRVGSFIWLRLKTRTGATNLLFRLQADSRGGLPVSNQTPSGAVFENQRLSGEKSPGL